MTLLLYSSGEPRPKMHETLATMITSRRRDQRAGRAEPQPVEVVVARGVLLDVDVALRDVGFGLVVVVVADEVLDGVVGEQLRELLVELGGQRLVVADDQRRPAEPLRSRGPW